MNDNTETISNEKSSKSATPHQHVVAAIGIAAACAFGTFVLGALWGAPWPAAIASCGISLMGVGAAVVMLRRA